MTHPQAEPVYLPRAGRRRISVVGAVERPAPAAHPRAVPCCGVEFSGVVVPGDARGRELGFPTANLEVPAGTPLPADGVYVAFATVPAWWGPVATSRRAALSIGRNPTFGTDSLRVEAHLLDFDGDLYGRTVRIRVLDYLRQMRAFPDLDTLVDAITADVAAVRRWEW